ncbi:MAG: hypothetical protein QOG59_1222 [Solirubrobacteraceae bacterium]|nr:hypothetical protein [Solirubrobacteraceae bacterium]
MADGGARAEAQIDALYELPLEEFTPARNQLAQRLRRNGERERSEEVKRLRKPTLAAWTLNQLRRRQPEVVSGLLDAGMQLRQAQERLLGEGERGVLREAATQERRLVGETVHAAEAVLREARKPVSTALQRKLWETTHAAAIDPELGDMLRRGRLIEDSQISDLGLMGGSGGPERRGRSEPRGRSKPRGRSDPRGGAEKPKRSTQLRRRLEQARKRQQKLDEKLAAALGNVELADQQVTSARTNLERAEAELERAETRAARERAEAERARDEAMAGAQHVRELDKPDS